jgi:NDP-sugar pyrophosphorylase family protein
MDKTLLIMAAGMGSRFGGLKQIEPVGPNGEFIIDYSIYDAIKAGFTKVVFVIKKENFEVFKETVGNRVSKHIKVEYAFQDMDALPEGFVRPVDREKPWGTSHAILAAKDLIDENFAIINADDFYGRDAYYVVSDFLGQSFDDNTYCVVGYRICNTLSLNGSVKRGVCHENNGYLTDLIESKVEYVDDRIVASPLSGADSFEITPDTLVSMNMLGFNTSIFDYIENNFPKFLESNKDNILKCEYLIPDTVFDAMDNGFCHVKLLETSAKWQGITYKEDKQLVVDEINSLIESGVYPAKLWD